MNEVQVTLSGTVATQPKPGMHNGVRLVGFRMVSTERRFDKESRSWVDGQQVWTNVTCWRLLAVNVEESISQGDRVVVHGKMRTDEWMQDGVRRSGMHVTAFAVGHDLSFGTALFTRRARQDDEMLAAREAEIELARQFEDPRLDEQPLDDPEHDLPLGEDGFEPLHEPLPQRELAAMGAPD